MYLGQRDTIAYVGPSMTPGDSGLLPVHLRNEAFNCPCYPGNFHWREGHFNTLTPTILS